MGNWWDFKFVMNGIPYYQRRVITGDTIINGKNYAKYYHGYPQNFIRYYRYETADTSFHFIYLGADKICFKMNAIAGDSGQISGNIYWKLYQKYVTINTVWGNIDSCMRFRIYSIVGVDGYETFGLAPRIGNIEQFIGSFTYSNIDSAMVGGTHYPLLTKITAQSSVTPKSFSLFQNYPNPFKPVTKIKFDIPSTPLSSIGEGPGVRLIIYDILGKEITVLVNEQLQPGTYEVEWDGSNSPSGVYFYRLITKDYSETKKMVLIK